MIISGDEDLHVQKTVKGIRRTFINMLRVNDYDKITVTALCQNAKINKKTFYRYYETLDFLLTELLEKMIKLSGELLAGGTTAYIALLKK